MFGSTHILDDADRAITSMLTCLLSEPAVGCSSNDCYGQSEFYGNATAESGTQGNM
jgi:hypothetical protein